MESDANHSDHLNENLLIIWPIAIDMGGTVHQPSHIQYECPSEHSSNEPGIFQCFTPKQHWHHSWHYKACNWHQNQIISAIQTNQC